MAKHRIAVIAGDGIGQEVMPEGLRVLVFFNDMPQCPKKTGRDVITADEELGEIRYYAHDEENTLNEGDRVRIEALGLDLADRILEADAQLDPPVAPAPAAPAARNQPKIARLRGNLRIFPLPNSRRTQNSPRRVLFL